MKNIKIKKLDEDGTSYQQNVITPDKTRQNIWQKVKKSSIVRQDQNSLISAFA